MKAFTIVESLRAIADLLEAHPELQSKGSYSPDNIWQFHHEEVTADMVQAALVALGDCKKSIQDNGSILLTKDFGPLRLAVHYHHQNFCKKVTREKLVEIEEWDCPKCLALALGVSA